MNLKPILVLCVSAGMYTAAQATNPDKIVVTLPGSENPVTVDITNTTRITFGADEKTLNISDNSLASPLTFNVKDIEKITFDLDINSAKDISSDLGDMLVSNSRGVFTISTKGKIAYGAWTATGQQILSGTATDNVEIDFTTLPAGVYILKANNRTIKFVNK